MEKDKVLCEECREFVEYTVVEERREVTLWGVPCSHIEIRGECVKCGNWLYVPEFNDENLDRLWKDYRSKTNQNKN